MRIFARLMYGLVSFASRKGISDAAAASNAAHAQSTEANRKARARRTGVRGETFAYWYLRRHGYTMIATNYTAPGIRGEVDLVGYDGAVLAFIEVKTRSAGGQFAAKPEDAVNAAKRRNVSRMARQFMRDSRIPRVPYRFDVLAIESRPGRRPLVRLHKSAFAEQS
ncbi:MAG: YraN family protein [Candidatus Acidiferrales bacterium]|jgi:putative endonuclease